MNLHLVRKELSEEGIFGELLDETGVLIAYTLEHSYSCHPKVPVGTYECVRGMHSLSLGSPFETFEVTGVPGHSGILFHCGNTQSDSSGCILVGSHRYGNTITESRLAFQRFIKLQEKTDSFTLVVQ